MINKKLLSIPKTQMQHPLPYAGKQGNDLVLKMNTQLNI